MLIVLGLFMYTKMVENCWQVMVCGIGEFVVAYMHLLYIIGDPRGGLRDLCFVHRAKVPRRPRAGER